MKIGVIGLGAMGLPIAKRLLDAGHALHVFDLCHAAVQDAQSAGANAHQTAASVGGEAEVIVLSLPNAAIVRGVLEELLEAGITGKIVLDLSSIAPDSARQHAELAQQGGAAYLDCPVSGGVGGAQAGALTVMAGGSKEDYARVLPILQAIGRNLFHVGPAGAGSAIKMVNNFILGCNMATVAEALVMGSKIGLDLDTMYEILQISSGRSFIVENKIPNFIKKRSFTGGFAVDLAYKDLGLAVESAKQLQMPIPMGSTAVQVFQTARAKGFGKEDITSLVKLWEELMDVEVH